jgi:F420-non-reducing hydrogenase iron-sulfur subunit
MQYPTNVKLIRLPCSGRCDPLYILTAFKAGADGVLVTGCRLEQCHFKEGNYKAVDRVKFLKMILDEIGFGGERLHLQFMSAGEPDEFVKAVVDMTDRIKRLGPSPKKELES